MNIQPSPNLCRASSTPPMPVSRHEFDPWRAEHAFTLLEQRHPDISRAMLGPLAIGCPISASGQRRRCLAATADGAFIAATWVSQSQFKEPHFGENWRWNIHSSEWVALFIKFYSWLRSTGKG